ncbi:hypothetical protein [Aliivibrio fischeri]|jgi:hypothetical protein|uniref:hypothetical protein n=1 Tax=Aliivibrio fischeri TaxID=668 RepID=UPI0012DAF5D5|nr:hypothetical protein [Aliivibrio fischeri]MUL11887.1 hypothetical protein [Aliivibrio fischeri]MUL15545.1 hypothetical protein [Aliivibrio fischeri]
MSELSRKQLVTAPVAAIVITVIVCISILFGFGRFEKPVHDYATVKFDGGYKKIGVISEQRDFSKIEVMFNDTTLWSGDINAVISGIEGVLKSEKEPLNVTWKEGVTVNGTAGVSWIGSESSFNLTTETIDLMSTNEMPLSPVDVIEKLKQLDRKVKDTQESTAQQSLTFSVAPNTSFTLTKLISVLRNL